MIKSESKKRKGIYNPSINFSHKCLLRVCYVPGSVPGASAAED
jgi:hypothetical protein